MSGLYRLEEVDITDISPTASEDLKQEEGEKLNSVIELTVARDTRDSIFEPTRGSRNSVDFAFAGLGGDTQFYKVVGESAWFVPLPVFNLVWAVRGLAGIVEGYGGEEVPIFERFFLGGATTLRGQRTRSVAPKDAQGETIGGTSELLFNTELLIPIFPRFRLALFFDAGNAYGFGTDFDPTDLRLGPAWGCGSSRRLAPCGSISGTTWIGSRGRRSFRSISRSDRPSRPDAVRGDAMRDRWTLGIVALVAGALIGGPVAMGEAAGTRIGYVDVQKVIVRSVAGVAAREQLEREKVTMQKDVDNRRTEVDKLREEMDKKGMVLSAEARREKDETLQRKVRDLRRLAEDLEKELQKKEQQATQRILQELTGVIEKMGKERGFLLIVERRSGGVIYGDPEHDITDEVIKVYDQEKAKEKK